MTYRADIAVELDAASAQDAHELLERHLDHLFNETWVVELRCGAPTWVPVKGSAWPPEGAA